MGKASTTEQAAYLQEGLESPICDHGLESPGKDGYRQQQH